MLISKWKWLRNCVSEHLKEERRYSCGAMTETTAALNDLDKQKGPHGSASRPQRLDFYCFYRSSTTCRPVLLYCCCLFNVQRSWLSYSGCINKTSKCHYICWPLKSRERVSSARRLSEGELGSIKTPQNDVRKGRNTNQLVFLRRVVMKAMMQHRLSLSFRKPVDAALLNLFDYHDIIKEPIYLLFKYEKIIQYFYVFSVVQQFFVLYLQCC